MDGKCIQRSKWVVSNWPCSQAIFPFSNLHISPTFPPCMAALTPYPVLFHKESSFRENSARPHWDPVSRPRCFRPGHRTEACDTCDTVCAKSARIPDCGIIFFILDNFKGSFSIYSLQNIGYLPRVVQYILEPILHPIVYTVIFKQHVVKTM